jgi:Flp pilus assembly protein TadG
MAPPRRRSLPRRDRGQALVEFAFVAPVALFLIFAILEGGLLLFTIATSRFAAGQGAIRAAELGNASNADAQAIQAIRTGPLGSTSLAIVSEIDIYRLVEQSNGQLTVDSTAYNRYRLDGSAISVTWQPAARSVRQGFTDFLGLTIDYQYTWASGRLLAAAPLQLSQAFDVRLEAQTY